MRKKKKTYASVMKKTGNIRYSQKGRRAGKIALPPQVMRVGMQSLLAVLWEITMFFIFGDIFLTNRFGKPALIWVSVSAVAMTVSFSYFKKADKWLLPVGELLVGLVLSRKELYPGLAGLIHVSLQDLMRIHGIGQVKAVQLKCIGELSRRIARTAARPQLVMNDPSSIAAYYMEQLRHEEQELVLCMMSDVKGHFLGDKVLTRGTVTGSLVTPREIYLEALRYHAVSLILIHNHPSGDPTPSQEDMEITARIYQAGELLGIHLLDHIVIGDQRYCSFRETGLWDECTG